MVLGKGSCAAVVALLDGGAKLESGASLPLVRGDRRVLTPLGVAAETMGLWGRLQAADSLLVKAVCALPLVNVVLAPIGYRSLLKKAVRAWDGLTKED